MEQAQPQKRKFPGESALLAGLFLNSFAVTMIVKSNLGISVVSGVPYVFSLVFPRLTMGTWNTLIQCLWMLVPILTLRRFHVGYLISFLLAIVFGFLLDFWARLLAPLPGQLAFRILWFFCGYVAMSCGIAFFMRCRLPVLPFDMVPREFVYARGISVRAARTTFDMINLVLMLALGLIFLGYPAGIGIGSIFNALLIGTGSGFAVSVLDRHLDIAPHCTALKRLS